MSTVVSVTRIRLRALRFVPFFLIHAQRCLMQIRRSDGYIAGALRHDCDGAYWTISLWRDDLALTAYVTSGAHRNAMPKLADWAAEASFVRWTQDADALPGWPETIGRMRRDGKRVTLPHGKVDHAVGDDVETNPSFCARI